MVKRYGMRHHAAKIKLYISQSNNTYYILQFNCEVMMNRMKHFRTYSHNILKRRRNKKSQKNMNYE